jgi:P27 family predicted phage terminase small subunit
MNATANKNDRPPKDFTPAMKSEWKRIRGELAKAGRLTATPGAAIESYCRAYGLHQEAYADLAKTGFERRHPNGICGTSPAAKLALAASSQMLRLLAAMGLTKRPPDPGDEPPLDF